jgi:hypothetical protein
MVMAPVAVFHVDEMLKASSTSHKVLGPCLWLWNSHRCTGRLEFCGKAASRDSDHAENKAKPFHALASKKHKSRAHDPTPKQLSFYFGTLRANLAPGRCHSVTIFLSRRRRNCQATIVRRRDKSESMYEKPALSNSIWLYAPAERSEDALHNLAKQVNLIAVMIHSSADRNYP